MALAGPLQAFPRLDFDKHSRTGYNRRRLASDQFLGYAGVNKVKMTTSFDLWGPAMTRKSSLHSR